MDISIVVPFHNAEKYLTDCINALLLQSYPADRYEIIMVDNNSTDRSAEIVKQYPQIRLLAEPKQGSYAARNRGVAVATGKIIAFTDSDCVPARDWLEKIAATMERPDVGIVLGPRQYANNSLSLSLLAAYEAEKAGTVFCSNTKEIYYGHTNNMGIRKSLFDRLGLFLEIARGADTIFVRQAVNAYSCDIVHYSRSLYVQHLEITGIRDFYQKRLVYGQSNQNVSKIINFRPLSNAERMQIFKRTVQGERYNLVKTAFLFFLLVPGAICYELAQQRATQTRKSKRTIPLSEVPN